MTESNRGGITSAIDEWRAFLGWRYQHFLGIGVGQAAVSALAGDGLTIPFLLTLGAHPALATVIGVLPFAFSSAQLLVPRLLRQFDGNLRGLTMIILLVGETRGFLLRRFVAPRVMGVNLGLGAFLLLPVALLVQVTEPAIGILVYALVFFVAGIAGIAELMVVTRLPKPGRVQVASTRTATRPNGAGAAIDAQDPKSEAGPASPAVAPASPAVAPARELDRFLRVVTVAAFGAGFGPYLSIYAISVLGLPPASAILIAALSSAAALVSATIVGGLLGRGSSSRFLRLSFLLRGGSMIFGLLAFPQNRLAWLVCASWPSSPAPGPRRGRCRPTSG